jgi:tetratricopeptide (TPR) repeat protein
MLDCTVFGADPGAHHLVNVLLHVLNVVLLYAWWLRWGGSMWSAAFVAALFAWHPLRVESVAWIAERKDVLCATFGLLALHAYADWVADRRPRRLALVAVWFALGLMAKPMLVTLPCLFLLLDVWPLRRLAWTPFPWREARACVLEKWPLWILTAASCVVTVLAQRATAIRTFDEVGLSLRVANAVVSYAAYVGQTLWPAGLSVHYPMPPSVPPLPLAVALLVLGAISWLAWRERGRCPWLLTGWLWFAGMLVPVIGLVAVGGHARADRYMYLPQVGLFVMVAWTVHAAVGAARLPPRLVAGAAGLALVLAGFGTWQQLGHWRDAESLFRRALAVHPGNAMAHINLGSALEAQGRPAEALHHYQAALRLQPRRAQVHNNLGNVLDALGRHEEALGHYREALRLKPGTALVHRNMGASEAARGRPAEALAHYAEALRLDPEDPQVHYLMGVARLRLGDTRGGIADLREALRRHPGHARALNQLARVLATDEDAGVRNGPEAVRLATRAVEVTDGRQPQALDTLGMALAEAGRFPEAAAAARQAADLLEAIGEAAEASAVRARAALYEARQPVRQREHGR